MPTRAELDELAFTMARTHFERAIEEGKAAGTYHEGQAVALDFDGPIHGFGRGWHDGTVYDEPAPFARQAVELLGRYYDVPIFTARGNVADAAAWLEEHGFPFMKITNQKPPALAFVDDRAVQWRSWPQAIVDLATLLGRRP